jgi:predicted helicase
MNSYSKIFIIDLHGNARKKEVCPDGSKDENVFDIMQGVSINIFVKKSAKSKKPADVYHYDLFGTRESKYEYLLEHSLFNVEWQQLTPQVPSLFFVPKDFSLQEEYEKGFSIDELMKINGSGIETQNDKASIGFYSADCKTLKDDFQQLTMEQIAVKYGFKDGRDWKISTAKEDISKHPIVANTLHYRPFDFRSMNYTGYSRSMMAYPRFETMRHLTQTNMALLVKRGFPYQNRAQGFVTEYISDRRAWSCSGMQGAESVFPLYLYPEEGSIDMNRRPNLDETIWSKINSAIGHGTTPEDIFDYIYGILHSPAYRAKYKEFLKVDFPRIPYPKNADEFEHFRHYGNLLRELHLMHNVPESPSHFDNVGSGKVDFLQWEPNKDDGYSGNVWINEEQCFDCIPTEAWEMFIGGYQPAQKWLKDRRGRTLSYDDIQHYRHIISVLQETARLMREIDR